MLQSNLSVCGYFSEGTEDLGAAVSTFSSSVLTQHTYIVTVPEKSLRIAATQSGQLTQQT